MNSMWKRIVVIFLAVLAGTFLKSLYNEHFTKQDNNLSSAASLTSNNAKYKGVTLSGRTMGTTYSIIVFPNEVKGISTDKLKSEVDSFLKDFNKEFSTYDPTSVISNFNKLNDTKEFSISPSFAKVIKSSQKNSKLTNGYLDVTVYPLVKAWGFGPSKPYDSLTEEEVNIILQHVGIEKLSLLEKENNYYLVKKDPQVQIDFSAIAKGYGVDEVSRLIAEHGARNFLVEIGGEVVSRGINLENQKPWGVALEHPNFDGTKSIEIVINPENEAVATSGTYRNFRFANGKRISHEIDPSNGFPIQHTTVSLTVVSDNCMDADALATGLFVMGKDKALEIANKNNIAIYAIYLENGEYVSAYSEAFYNKFASSLKNKK